jgi:quercetin dioxygenase-like cupin family protein
MKAEGSGTGGSVTVFENVLRPRAPGPARHFHRTWTEIFYVLAGEMNFEVDSQLRSAPTGTFVFVPPGTVHAFRNPMSDPAKLLITFIPGGFEGFFDQAKDLGSPMTDAAAWQQINERWDVQVVGPPLEEEDTAPA